MEELSKADIKFSRFLNEWAASQGKVFKVESFHGREIEFQGMAVDDVWGWLLNDENESCTDENFGCVEWKIKNNELILEWDLCEE